MLLFSSLAKLKALQHTNMSRKSVTRLQNLAYLVKNKAELPRESGNAAQTGQLLWSTE